MHDNVLWRKDHSSQLKSKKVAQPGLSFVDEMNRPWHPNGNGGYSPAVQVIEVTAAQVAAPTAAMLANLAAVYQLNAAPFSRYVSNGSALVAQSVPALASLADNGIDLRRARLDRLGAKPIGFNAYEMVYRTLFEPSYNNQPVLDYAVQSGANLLRIAYPCFFAADWTTYVFASGVPTGEMTDADFKPSFLAKSDAVFNAAAASKVKLLVCLFFYAPGATGLFGESLIDGIKITSATYDFMKRFTRWFAKRHANHPAFGAYSFFNEVRYDPAGVTYPTPANLGAVHSGLIAEMRALAPVQVATSDYNLFILNTGLVRQTPATDFEYIKTICEGVDAMGVHVYSYTPDGFGMSWVGYHGSTTAGPQQAFGPAPTNTLGYECLPAYLSALRGIADSMGVALWLTETGVPTTIESAGASVRRKRLLGIIQSHAEVSLLWNLANVAAPQTNQLEWQIQPGATLANTYLPLVQKINAGRVPFRGALGGGLRPLKARQEPQFCMSGARAAGATVRVVSSAALTKGTQAVMFWYRRDATLNAFEGVIDSRGADNNSGFTFIAPNSPAADIEYIEFRAAAAAAANSAGFTVRPDNGDWIHFAFIFRPINGQIAIEMWMDGLLWGAKAANNPYVGIPSGTTLYFCGGRVNGAPVSLQDVAVLASASPEDIWAHMNGAVLPQSLLHLRADANGVADFSRNNLDVTVGAGAVFGAA